MITFTQGLSVTPGATINVPVGTIVSWYNNDKFNPHGVQAIGATSGLYFGDTAAHSIAYGKTYNVTFSQKGSYDYATIFQPQVQAKIIVT
jgi:plastocyanin